MLRASLPAIGAVVVSLALPAAGHAADVRTVVEEQPCSFSGCSGSLFSSTVIFSAGANEANRVEYAFEPGLVVFTERGAAPLTAGAGCQERRPGVVACSNMGSPAIRIETGDGADRVAPPSGGAPEHVSILGGPGDDVLAGGSGADRLDGGGGHDELHAGGGDDDLADGDGPRGDADTLDGGRGADEVSYAGRTDDLTVDLDRSAGPDGDVLGGLESVTGGSGDDRLTASNRTTSPNGVPEDSVRILDGGKGRDTLRGRSRHEYLFGGEGRDVLVGGKGDDTLGGGSGRDRVSGGPGFDEIETRDGTADVVRCGSGRDVVSGYEDNGFGESEDVGPDARDQLARDCEAVGIEGEERGIPVYPLRVGRAGLRLRNACRPCSRATVTIRIGKRVAARGRMAGRRAATLAWRRPPARGRKVDARIAWDFPSDVHTDYAFTVRLRIR